MGKQTLGRFEEKYVLRLNQQEIVKCPYCNEVGYDAAHVAWLCLRLDVERYVWREIKRTKQQKDNNEPRKWVKIEIKPTAEQVLQLPALLRVGLPVELGSALDGGLWA